MAKNNLSDIKQNAISKKAAVGNTVKGAVNKRGKSVNSKVASGKLELLITIVNRNKAEFYQDLLQEYEVNMQLACNARGTAKSQMLALLGLEVSPKTAIFSFIKEEKVNDALAMLETKFQTIKDGAGIAYTIPLTSVIGVAIYGFLSNNVKTVKEDKQQ
ncbi:MAG: hypothetical protein NC037_01150 [Bacteroides sp.]|nr:hypothetical protein [Bacillota bacterium]MCM1393804.1 hypothetical protein [[Eubacterium] siraeum]MCM1455123.1 hypothetical protein [Bacteroides sp.]